MKKTLPLANVPFPKFASDEAAAEYLAAHSVAEAWDQLPVAKPAKLARTLTSSIQERHSAKKSPISIRLGPEQIAAAKRIASAKSVGYQTQLRMWIAEGIRRDGKRL
ncbi:MAG: BrnA antitoxin family protein [Bryobacteraceae bacterium]|nr:BrnA antitoxin family protein [Bryobacteraceae bacterium]